MGLLSVLLRTTVLAIVTVAFLSVAPVPLPYPADRHKVLRWALYEQPSPLEGTFRPNTALQSAKKLLTGKIQGSESVAVTPSGEHLFLADKFGSIFKGKIVGEGESLDVVLEPKEPIARVEGRLLGIHAVSENELLGCELNKGLVKIDAATGSVATLASIARAKRKYRNSPSITFANDLDIADNGHVYFTDSTDIPPEKGPGDYISVFRTYFLNLMEGGRTGRLLSFNPETNKTMELKGKLWYANGVAVAKDGSFVAVVETNGLRVHRYWLKGALAGKSDILISGLPGFPDGISTAPDGNFWIALVAPMTPLWRILPFPGLRLILAWLTEYVHLPFKSWGYVVKVSPQGKVLAILADVDGGFVSSTASAVERDGRLFLGNLEGDYISVFDLSLLKKTEEERHDAVKEEL